MHIIRVSQARSFTESSPSELFSESEMEPSQLLSASQVAEDAVEYKKKKVKTCAQLKEAVSRKQNSSLKEEEKLPWRTATMRGNSLTELKRRCWIRLD